jgi:hypothetical protein
VELRPTTPEATGRIKGEIHNVKFITIILFSAASLLAQNATAPALPAVPQELLGKATRAVQPRASTNMAADASSTTTDSATYETPVTTDSPITVEPGQFYFLPQSRLDFSDANHASIAVQNANVDLTGLRILAAWAAPGAWFNLTEISQNINFPVLDHGGLFTPAYGPRLKVVLYNASSAPLQVKQISVYATK